MLRTLRTPAELSSALDAARAGGATVGLVPTMGALHAGHRSLIERAAAECDLVAVTIFVNPLQFGDPGDLGRYPRTLDADRRQCEAAGAALVFAPSLADMYPGWPDAVPTTVSVAVAADRFEGASRPGHFDGVSTVVAKLFAMAGRCRAYFGEKDFQQLVLVRRLAADLSFPVEVVGCPTVRAADGLALSSRNVHLSSDEREAARVLFRALDAGRRALDGGAVSPAAVVAAMAAVVETEPLAELDYAAVVDPGDLSVPERVDGDRPLRLLIAARVGPVRLIDNAPTGPLTGPHPTPVGAGAAVGVLR
jgi:pantoate--beta-alanine ligase